MVNPELRKGAIQENRLFKAENAMNIIGQGLKIILFTVPSETAAESKFS
jgi:hypothetical protein